MFGSTLQEMISETPRMPSVIFFEPIWEPYNDVAHALVADVCADHGLSTAGPIGRKRQIVVASLLQAAKALGMDDKRTIACSGNSNVFTGYSNEIGRTVVWSVVEALDGSILQQKEGSGSWTRHTSELLEAMGMSFTYAQVTNYAFTAGSAIRDALSASSFIQKAVKQPLRVNIAETQVERYQRKSAGKNAQRMSSAAISIAFSRDAQIIRHEVNLLNQYYAKHPLQRPSNSNTAPDFHASAYRVFHSGRLDAGGRFYGAWTHMPEIERLASTVDGESLVSVDLNASQPFLFSMLMGIPLNLEQDTWADLYADILGQAYSEQTRGILKTVAMEVIGAGNPNKAEPSDENRDKFDGDDWQEYRDLLLKHVPALDHLDADYMNGHGFLAFHEAEILKQTLFKLMSKDVPAYSVHDCLLVKASQSEEAMQVYRDTVNGYIKDHCRKHKRRQIIDCYPALKVTSLEKETYREMGSQRVM